MSTTTLLNLSRNTKRFWRLFCEQEGVEYRQLLEVYNDLRTLEKAELDTEKGIRLLATKRLFPDYLRPETWWGILHVRLNRLVGDSDLTVIPEFDKSVLEIVRHYPELDRGEPLKTAQYVFEFLLSDPLHMRVPSLEKTMFLAWERAFGDQPLIDTDDEDVPF